MSQKEKEIGNIEQNYDTEHGFEFFQKITEKKAHTISKGQETKPTTPTIPNFSQKRKIPNFTSEALSPKPEPEKGTINFTSQSHSSFSFGPKIIQSCIKSKEDCIEDIPLDVENDSSSLYPSIVPQVSHSDFHSQNSLLAENLSMETFYDIYTSEVAKEEDNFWRLEREDPILDRLYQSECHHEGEGKQRCQSSDTAGVRKKGILKGLKKAIEGSNMSSEKSVRFNDKISVRKFLNPKHKWKKRSRSIFSPEVVMSLSNNQKHR